MGIRQQVNIVRIVHTVLSCLGVVRKGSPVILKEDPGASQGVDLIARPAPVAAGASAGVITSVSVLM